MNIEHLTPSQAAIFRVIRQHGEISRARIIDTLCRKGPHKMPEGTISSGLSRLEGFGFVARPDVANGVDGWRLTPEGAALFALENAVECVDPPCPEPQPQDPPNPKPEPEPEPEPPPTESPIDPWIIEAHLEFVRAQLAAPPTIPRETARVYREIVKALPLSLVEALLPITRLVESRS